MEQYGEANRIKMNENQNQQGDLEVGIRYEVEESEAGSHERNGSDRGTEGSGKDSDSSDYPSLITPGSLGRQRR